MLLKIFPVLALWMGLTKIAEDSKLLEKMSHKLSPILKKLFPDVPVIAGGIEASLRRLSHYDYWQDRLMPSILDSAPVDMVCYGMGEIATIAIADALNAGTAIEDLSYIPQTVVRRPLSEIPAENDDENIVLHSFDECKSSKRCQAENFRNIEI